MKRTKNFFIALLGFCLMGSGIDALAETVTINNVVYEVDNGVAVVSESPDAEGDIVIEGTVNGVNVTEIGQAAFLFNEAITALKLPKTVTTIRRIAFMGCKNLESVDLSNVTVVEQSAFQDCEGITSLTIGEATVGKNAFNGTSVSTLTFVEGLAEIPAIGSGFASTLKKVVLPSSSGKIPDKAFENCTALEEINLSESVTEIGKNAFYNCKSLKSLSYRFSPVTIGDDAFSYSGIASIILSGTKSIGDYAFQGCSNLAITYWPEFPASIGIGAFKDCLDLTNVDLSNVTSIGSSAFEGCGNYVAKKGLQEVIWSNTVTIIPDNVFYGCSMLSTVNGLFEVATEIGDYAFYNTSSLKGTVTFSDELTSVGEGSFVSSSVDAFVFETDLDPSSVGTDAFGTTAEKILNINDDKLYSAGNTYDNVVYSRTKNGTYGALVLPFDFEKGGNNTYYTFTSYDEKGMHFTQVEDNELKADTPYLYTGSDTKFNSVGEYKTVGLEDRRGDAPDGWTSNCVYEDHSVAPITENGYMWAIQGGELKWFNSLKIKPYRAYWQTDNKNVSQNARVFVHTRDGNVTSINMAEIDGWENMVPVYYDLTGRMVNNPVKGNIYIVNGKKVVF